MKPIIDSINHEMSVNEVNVAQSNFIFFFILDRAFGNFLFISSTGPMIALSI